MGKMKPKSDNLCRAVHEAAHCIAAEHLGVSVTGAYVGRRVEDAYSYEGRMITGGGMSYEPIVLQSTEDLIWHSPIDLSGPVAEQLFLGRICKGTGFWNNKQYIDDLLPILSHIPEADRPALVESTTQLVEANWPVILALAEQLVAAKSLDGAAIRAVISSHS